MAWPGGFVHLPEVSKAVNPLKSKRAKLFHSAPRDVAASLLRFTPEPFPERHLSPEQIIARYYEIRAAEALYPVTRGVHASALCTPERVPLMAEDVGRHNTLDKLWGKAMLAGVETKGRIIVTTGPGA